MNILQILPELNVGGVERGTVDLAKGLIKRGHKAVVVSGGGRMVKELKDCGVLHYTLPVGKKSLFTVLKCIPQVIRIVKDEKIDIVHCRSRMPAIIGFFASRKARVPFVTTCHGYYSKHLFSSIMGWGKLVIVPSNAIGRHMIENFGVPSDSIRLIPRGVDIAKYSFNPIDKPKKDGFRIGIAGRITPIKGHNIFLKAAAKVIRLYPKSKAVIIGEPPRGKQKYLTELKILARRLGISDNVEFLATSHNMAEVLSRLDLLAMPSISAEGFGRVIIEAQAAGVPVIGSRVGGIVDIIEDEKNGYLATPSDIKELSDVMLKVLKEKNVTQRLCIEARKRVEELFNLDKMVEKTLNVYEEARKSRILVIKLSSIGDVILAEPSFRAIDKNYPDADISVLVGSQARQIVQRLPYVDECIVYDRQGKDRGISGYLKLVKDLWRRHFDMAIDLQNNKLSHWLSFLSGAPKRYGYDNGKCSFLLNFRLKDIAERRADALSCVEHQFQLLRFIGIKPDGSAVELAITDEDEIKIQKLLDDEWLSDNQTLIGMNIAGSAKWQTKQWGMDKFAKLCDMLAQDGLRVALTGTAQEQANARALLSMTASHPINAISRTTIAELGCLIKHCRVFITPDSAPMHIAAAVGTPFIALFGPTNPKRHLPPAKDYIVIKKDLPCSPCYKRRCRNLVCMDRITVEEVAETVKKLIKNI